MEGAAEGGNGSRNESNHPRRFSRTWSNLCACYQENGKKVKKRKSAAADEAVKGVSES
jgi:hypothetical protein